MPDPPPPPSYCRKVLNRVRFARPLLVNVLSEMSIIGKKVVRVDRFVGLGENPCSRPPIAMRLPFVGLTTTSDNSVMLLESTSEKMPSGLARIPTKLKRSSGGKAWESLTRTTFRSPAGTGCRRLPNDVCRSLQG